MDKLTAVSGILFLVADIFAVASLAHPEWIVSDAAGKTTASQNFNSASQIFKTIFFPKTLTGLH